MTELILRFVIGGAMVSVFAMLGDILKPKSFAGIFGAAPSVALATMILTMHKDGRMVTAVEARSMLAGAVALGVYSLAVAYVLLRKRWNVKGVVLACMAIWFAAAFGLWGILWG